MVLETSNHVRKQNFIGTHPYLLRIAHASCVPVQAVLQVLTGGRMIATEHPARRATDSANAAQQEIEDAPLPV